MDPNDPSHHNDWRQDFGRDDNATWGWVAAAVFVAVVLFIAFTADTTLRSRPRQTTCRNRRHHRAP